MINPGLCFDSPSSKESTNCVLPVRGWLKSSAVYQDSLRMFYICLSYSPVFLISHLHNFSEAYIFWRYISSRVQIFWCYRSSHEVILMDQSLYCHCNYQVTHIGMGWGVQYHNYLHFKVKNPRLFAIPQTTVFLSMVCM